MIKYEYVRVSTAKQDLENQLQTLTKKGCTEIFSKNFIGTKADRPKFNELLSLLKEGDTLVVTNRKKRPTR
ncbi:MAG: recombinase family protein [Carnobacterium alterfunditum]